MTTPYASNDAVYFRRPLRTIRSKLNVPPAEKVTQAHINALAKSAAKLNVRILLKNGLRISPDGSVDRPEHDRPPEG
jgi:hypothetical protein